MSKALISESSLTAIADAIRAKAGTTASLKPGAMAAAIEAIPAGGNDKYGVGANSFFGEVSAAGQLALPTEQIDLTISGFESVAAYVFAHKFYRSSGVRSVVFTDLKEAKTTGCFTYGFYACTRLVSISFPELEEIAGDDAFYYCFAACTNLESVSFPKLRQIGNNANTVADRQFNYAFNGCTKLTELHFPALEAVYCNGTNANYGTFSYSNKLEKIYLPKCKYLGKASAYSNVKAGNGIFSNCAALKEIHFSASDQADIEACEGYATKWGATNATIYFDEEAPEGYESLTLTVGSGVFGSYTMKGFMSESAAAEEGMTGFGSASPASIGGQEIGAISAMAVGSSVMPAFVPSGLALMLKSDQTLDKDAIAKLIADASDGDVLEFWAKIEEE